MYPSDYLRDTVHLTLDEHGFYILMLQNLWEYDGELPADPKQLSRILRVDPRQARRYLQGKLGDMFEVSNGLVRNKRLSKELSQATDKHNKLSEAGRKGNAKRWSPGDTPPQSHTDTDTDTDIEKKLKKKVKKKDLTIPQKFAEWWEAYPKKRKKAEALKIWHRDGLEDQAEEIILATQLQKANDRSWIEGYIPDPTTYLNNERWTDEIDQSSARQNQSAKPSGFERTEAGVAEWLEEQGGSVLDDDEPDVSGGVVIDMRGETL
jgi:uncharacterized protein YdaU (DUF1376 family)